jgi:hypothetical protein
MVILFIECPIILHRQTNKKLEDENNKSRNPPLGVLTHVW